MEKEEIIKEYAKEQFLEMVKFAFGMPKVRELEGAPDFAKAVEEFVEKESLRYWGTGCTDVSDDRKHAFGQRLVVFADIITKADFMYRWRFPVKVKMDLLKAEFSEDDTNWYWRQTDKREFEMRLSMEKFDFSNFKVRGFRPRCYFEYGNLPGLKNPIEDATIIYDEHPSCSWLSGRCPRWCLKIFRIYDVLKELLKPQTVIVTCECIDKDEALKSVRDCFLSNMSDFNLPEPIVDVYDGTSDNEIRLEVCFERYI